MPVYILEMENKVTKCIIFVIPKIKPKKTSLPDRRDRHTGSAKHSRRFHPWLCCAHRSLTSWRGQRQLYKSDI